MEQIPFRWKKINNISKKNFLSDIKEEINDIKKRNPTARTILDFFEQYKVTAVKNLTSLVVISYINSTETLLYNVYLTTFTLGLRTIESALQEEFNSHPTETQIALLSKPFAATPFEIRVMFTLIGLHSILQKSDIFAFTGFGLSCFFLLPIHQNHALSETCGIISDMILINAIYNLAQGQCMHCYSNDLHSPST